MPRKAPKFQPIGTEEYKKKPSTLPLDIQIKKWCGHNKLVVAAGAVVVIGYILGSIFGRTRVASNFASGQGFDFDSSTDYKLPKRLSMFETLSRGSKQYAFNAMKGTVPFSDDGKEATVQAFDFSYTETKVTSSNKRVARAEKVHELTAMLFQAPNLAIKSLLLSPREMVLDVDEWTPSAQADPDVEDVMKGKPDESMNEDDEDDDDIEAPQVADESNETKAEPAAQEEAIEEPVEDVPVEEELELDTLSKKFNSTFVVETLDPVQTSAVINPALKALLLKNPNFIVDFQDKKFLIYREFTFETEDYDTVLEMGKAILASLNRELPAASKDAKDDPVLFVSRSKDEDAP